MSYPDRPEQGSLLHWREGAIARLHFNRPKALNAIDAEMANAFLRACQEIAADPLIRVLWMTAEGRSFMAGGDIAAMASDPAAVADNLIPGMHGGLQVLAALNAPVVASVQGAVAGGGLGMLLGGTDIIIAAEGTRFAVAYPLLGTSCDCSTSWALPRLIGLNKAMELALLGDAIDAAQALSLGLCNRVVPQSELETQSRALVERLAVGPTQAYGHLRRLIRSSLDKNLTQQLDAEAQGFRACSATADFREGIDAFLAKRPPNFQGR